MSTKSFLGTQAFSGFASDLSLSDPSLPDDIEALVQMLLEKAHDIARDEQHAPMLFLVGPERMVPVLAQFGSEEDKDRFAFSSRAIAKMIKACAAVFVTEAYLTFLKGPETQGLSDEELLSYARERQKEERVERQDTLLVTVEMRGRPTLVYAAKIGVPDGVGERKVGAFELMDGFGRQTGRFADLLGDLDGGEIV